jgi:hypothetical protein
MIDNDISFVQGVESPFSLGGLIGSLFFAGYMLTSFLVATWETGSGTARWSW